MPFAMPLGCSVNLVALTLAAVLFYALLQLVLTFTADGTRKVAQEPALEESVAPSPAPSPAPSLTPEPTPEPTDVWTEPVSGLVFARVPAGEFVMGSGDMQAPGCAGADLGCETPQHPVALGEYWIGLTEVTNTQFRAFVESGGYNNSAWWTDAGWHWRAVKDVAQPGCWDDPALNQPSQPVVCVGWHEAAAYTRWLSYATQHEFRLPTEAEWEKAARDADGRTYPWGEDPVSGLRANFCDMHCAHGRSDGSVDDGFAGPAPVGSFPFGASIYGALDMAGNVLEWTASEYRAYPVVNGDGRDGADGNVARALRGGSYYYTAEQARCAQRIGLYPDTRNDLIGFRVASGGP
jgi:formylglycine-generating enzyme required for sulfatase activity